MKGKIHVTIPKILFLSDVDISTPGGAQESMKILMEELGESFEFYLIGPSGKQINKRHRVLNVYKDFIVRGKGPLELMNLTKDLSNEIKKVNPDIIHVQMPSTLVLLNLLFSIGLLSKNVEIVYTDRGVYGKYGKITTLSVNSIIKKANKIVTTTYVNKNNYTELYKDYEKHSRKFEVIYNTAGKIFDSYVDEKSKEIRAKYHIKEKQFVVGFCGRYNEQKNWPLTKEIIETYAKDTNIKFIIVLGSDGTQQNYKDATEYIDSLKGKVGSNKILSFIDITNKEMAELYYAMDCFILTSKWESFGRTAVEAMARKNAVIGTGVDGLSEVIGNKQYIFNTAEEAVNIVDSIMNSREKLIESKEYFYNRYHSLFGYRINIQKYKKLYREILSGIV
ncbi:glycosyltransferase [Halalkalibacterium halodurans]|uniref:glycosyltransferase family 4 protein n=1 Tax=Halalkalibacterium halodurans TaxID=86665 RepID=UPI0010688CB5|nr:glycosyltransferase family 4 protein [Halalkalibacterium halodurans]TES53595.1 glycosyltransferase [Halalkalibacterium halodurans]